MWEATDLWPLTLEQFSMVSGSSDNKSFSRFCPEVAFERFGLFASELFSYADVQDSESAQAKLSESGSDPGKDWRWYWWRVHETHYSECSLYSLLPYTPSATSTPSGDLKHAMQEHDKRYQVFISSTYKDLMTERQAAIAAVLQMGHMPSGMELFPAANDSAWQWIKRNRSRAGR